MVIGQVITDKALPDIFNLLAHTESGLNLLLTAVERRRLDTGHDIPLMLIADQLCIRG